MGNYNNKGRSNSSYNNNVEMHPAVCDNCGKNCQVPFKPSGDKPIYCSECFETHGEKRERHGNGRDDRGGRGSYDRGGRGSYDRGGRGRDSGYRGSDDRNDRSYKAVCDNCGMNCEVPFKPTSGKPIYCSKCFNNKDSAPSGGNIQSQIEEINQKLDMVITALKPILPVKGDDDEVTFRDKKVVRKASDEPLKLK